MKAKTLNPSMYKKSKYKWKPIPTVVVHAFF